MGTLTGIEKALLLALLSLVPFALYVLARATALGWYRGKFDQQNRFMAGIKQERKTNGVK